MPQQPLLGGKPGVVIKFAGADSAIILRPIKYGRKGIDENCFHTLPEARLITTLPRIRDRTLPFEEYSTSCNKWFSRSALIFPAETKRSHPSAPRQRFALKVAFNVETGHLGDCFRENFRREALFYHQHLNKLQGIAVPKHYGVWFGRTSWGATVACAIMEWAGEPYVRAVVDPRLERADRRLNIMQSLKAVHDIGCVHNDLIDKEYRHLLYDREREKAFIIDFSTAERHRCHLNMEMKPYTTPPAPHIFGCNELHNIAVIVRFFGMGASFGPEADPEVQAANEKATQQYLMECATREADKQVAAIRAARLQASEARKRTVPTVAAIRVH
ncbi:hypothetical protein BD626DRAFT_488410 [Schizophyllum amplum]|uniref:Protein kinase domain-containing protein n=1 Tax=Schizophyllum amplum TaxID=97359 RepID=A0A550CKQ2_9AGAR|nr:hypothetical protein BD626DRAFT_488410 [Auriculariopsis ampla]